MKNSVGKRSPKGVFKFDNFRDNLLIDRYDPKFNRMRSLKKHHLRSENSEDAITWNVFKTLQQINPEYWFLDLFSGAFDYSKQDVQSLLNKPITIKLWNSLQPPKSLREDGAREGRTEVDVIIESEDFVWFIEGKYKSDVKPNTIQSKSRDQIIRNIDIGTNYAGQKQFFFSLLILNESYSRNGMNLLRGYKYSSIDYIESKLPHRKTGIHNLCNISWITWSDMATILNSCCTNKNNSLESFLAKQALDWLGKKGIKAMGNWWEHDIAKTYPNAIKATDIVLRLQNFVTMNEENQLVGHCLSEVDGYIVRGYTTFFRSYEVPDNWDEIQYVNLTAFNESGIPIWYNDKMESFEDAFRDRLTELIGISWEEYIKGVDLYPEEYVSLVYRVIHDLY